MVAWERSGANVQIKGATATGTSGEEHYHTALGAPLPTDRSTYAEVRCSGSDVFVGVARPDLEMSAVGSEQPGFWGVGGGSGALTEATAAHVKLSQPGEATQGACQGCTGRDNIPRRRERV